MTTRLPWSIMSLSKPSNSKIERDYTRAFGDGLRNFEPWSSDEDDTCAAPSLYRTTLMGNYRTTPMVKVSNHGRHVMSFPVPLKTRRVGQRCTLNLSRADY
ncbi:hypothetical protein TNCV_4021371 [Trichonephila clavipes]|nr:hypothetical protein TNCV_4021371 [Trichonephila clavipes]